MSKYSFKATAVATAVSGALMAATASAALPTNEALNKAYESSQKAEFKVVEEKRSGAFLVVLKQTTAADLVEQGNYTVDAARATYAAIAQAQADVSENLLKLDTDAKVYGSTKLLAPTLIVDASDEALDALMLSGKVARILPLRDYDLHVADVNEYINADVVNNDLGITGSNQKVAVLDTGIDYTHAVFGGAGTVEAYNAAQEDPTSVTWPQGQVVGGYDFIRDDADPIENDPNFSEGSATSHGTSVSHSVTGIAPDVELLVYSVCGGGCPSAAQISALEAAMDPNGDGDISDRADVINMSLGGEFGDTWTQDGTQFLIQRAVRLGTNVVISAGNDGDHPFRIGGPSTTPNALSVGAMTHPVTQNITTTDATLNDAAVEFGTASFGPEGTFTFSSEGKEFVYPDANQIACEDFGDDVDFTGKVVLIDRGGCGFSDKVLRAQNKGAEFVIIVNSADAGVINMGPSAGFEAVTIRSVMLTKADGQVIKDSIAAGTEFDLVIETGTLNIAGNAVAGFSSRGPSMDGLLKPEITAPGSAIMVADTGTQDKLAPASGTSFSGPITAGAVALVREARPELSSHEVKAILMNTADLNVLKESTALNPDTGLAPISLIGAGLVDVEKAIASPVVAMVHQPEYDTKQAALSFGFDILDEVTSYTKTVEVNNHSGEDKIYELSIQPRYQNDAEAGAASWDFPNEIKVPANGSIEFEVTVSIDPAKLPAWALQNPSSQEALVARADALTLSELDGALVFNDLEAAGDNSLHLVYHVLPKAYVGGELDVVDMGDEKVLSVTNTGYETLSLSPQMLVGSKEARDGAEFSVVSASTTVYGVSFCESGMLFSATMQLDNEITSIRQAGFEFLLDVDNDGTYDYELANYNDVGRSASLPGSFTSAFAPIVEGETDWSQGLIAGPGFHEAGTDSVMLSICSEDIGLTGDNWGQQVNVAAITGYPSYSLGVYSMTDAMEGAVLFATSGANVVNSSGEEVEELAPGETAYVMSDWAFSLNNGLSQVVTPVTQDVINEVIESRDNNAPVVDMHQQFYVDENVALGTVIGVLAHSDVDGDIVEFVVDGTGLVSVNSRGEIIVEGEIDYEYERNFRFDVTAVDAKGNTSEAVEVEVRVNDVKGGDDNDDNDSSGSLAWLALLAAPFAALRRRKQK